MARPGSSARAAADVLIAALEDSVRDPRRGQPGRWPPDNILLASFAREPDLVSTFLGALCHPLIDNQLALHGGAHLVGAMQHRFLPHDHRCALRSATGPLLETLEGVWNRALARAPRERTDPVLGRSLPMALVLLD